MDWAVQEKNNKLQNGSEQEVVPVKLLAFLYLTERLFMWPQN